MLSLSLNDSQEEAGQNATFSYNVSGLQLPGNVDYDMERYWDEAIHEGGAGSDRFTWGEMNAEEEEILEFGDEPKVVQKRDQYLSSEAFGIDVDSPPEWEFANEDMRKYGIGVQQKQQTAKSDTFFDLDEEKPSDMTISSELYETDGEHVVEKAKPYNREEYLELHKTLTSQRRELRTKHYLLHRKVCAHIRSNNLDQNIHPLRDTEVFTHYHAKLKEYGKLYQKERIKREQINAEKAIDMELRDEKLQEFNEIYEDFVKLEMDVGVGLLRSKTGHCLSEKEVKQMIRSQKLCMEALSSVRRLYLAVETKLTEQMSSVEALNNIGNGLKLENYVTMMMENGVYCDRLDEKEEELEDMRLKVSQSNQISSHFMQKLDEVTFKITIRMTELDEVLEDVNLSRQYILTQKKKRDKMRKKIHDVRKKAGLLLKHDLLYDFEKCVLKVQQNQTKLRNLKQTFMKEREMVLCLKKAKGHRKCIEKRSSITSMKYKSEMDFRQRTRELTLATIDDCIPIKEPSATDFTSNTIRNIPKVSVLNVTVPFPVQLSSVKKYTLRL